MSTPLYLGRPAYDPRPYTRIDPVAQADDGCWRVYNNWAKALPTEGRVFAPRLNGFREGDPLIFGVEPNQRGDSGADRYVVVDPRPVTEVLDFRSVAPEEARRSLVERGVDSSIPATDNIIAALGDGTCVRMKMERHPTLGRLVAHIDGLETLNSYVFDARLFEGDRIGGRWIAVPGITVGAPVGVLNWCRDSDFLEAVLKRLRKAAPQAESSLTRSQLSQVVTYLSRAGLLPTEGAELNSFHERLQSFAPNLAHNVELIDKLVDAICVLRPIEIQLASRREEIEANLRRGLEDRLLQELEKEMEPLSAERDHLAAEVTELSARLDRERKEVQQAVDDAEGARQAIKDELSIVLSQLADVPTGAEETISTLAARIRTRLKEPAQDFGLLAAPGAPWTKPDFTQRPFNEWTEFGQILRNSSFRRGYDPTDLMLIDVAARSGELVIFPEDRGSGLVSCYADAISGGEVVRHILDPAILCVDDLWRQPSNSLPAAFGRAWAAARYDPRRFRVVSLEGLHRTPIDLWLPTLVDLLKDSRRPSNLLVFASIGASLLDKDRIWQDMDRAVIALAPAPSAGLTPYLLAQASGREPSPACFDAASMPLPISDDVLGVLTEFDDTNGIRLRRLASIYRSARAVATEIDTKSWLSAFAETSGADAEISSRLSNGAKWLRELLSRQD
ncbi:hypothetical protein [Bradyrhizobium sp. CCBAU 53415]|uniref:hypothetical protein n=1 Tax=Bradyrhizobium sp. CCBAU 53415 TaxID=1325119 RepID=UPI00230525F6|nr:hypothetical protein [Bradyrhizobium sp. CCBAU 53415]